jgi:hypothetical protein
VTLPLDGSADGPHTLTFSATDPAGNVSAPTAFSFTLDTKAPQIALASNSIADGGTLAQGAELAGTVTTEPGVALTALSYAFDGGAAMPIGFDPATGNFDQALDLSKLGTGNHTLNLTAIDAAGNTTTDTLNLSLPALRAHHHQPHSDDGRERCRQLPRVVRPIERSVGSGLEVVGRHRTGLPLASIRPLALAQLSVAVGAGSLIANTRQLFFASIVVMTSDLLILVITQTTTIKQMSLFRQTSG